MFLTSLVLAALISNAKADQPPTTPPPASTPDPSDEILPSRQAKATIHILKQSFDGKSSTTVTPVCDMNVTVPVFDTRGKKGQWWYQATTAKCNSTLETTPVNVKVIASINLTDLRDPVDHTDRKYFNGSMWIEQASSVPMPVGDYNAAGVSAWTHDLTARSLGLDLQPSVPWLCVSSGPSKTEPFPDPIPKKLVMQMSGVTNLKTQPSNSCKPMLDQWFQATIEFQD